MEIYFIDVEGGAATLTVTPSGQSMLVDSGNPTPTDRDAKRIFEAAQIAGLKKIDMLITTHYHGDHVGGVADAQKSRSSDGAPMIGTSPKAMNSPWNLDVIAAGAA